MQKLAARFPNSPTDFSLLYLGSTWLPRDLGPLLRLARRRGIPIVVNQDGVGYPGWAGDTHRGGQPAAPRAAPGGRPRPLPERVLEALGRPLPRRAERCRGRSCRTRSTSSTSPRPTRRPRTARCSSSAATRRRRTGSSSRCGRSPRSLPAPPEARLLVTGRLVSPIEPLVERARAARARPRRSASTRSATRRRSSAGRTSSCTRRSTTRARRSSSRRWRAGCPSSTRRAAGRVELVGDEAGIGVPHPDTWERDEPPTPEALADAVDRVLADLRPLRAAARARAVERFALEPWLERHAELFAELVAGSRVALRPRSVARWSARALRVEPNERASAAPPSGRTSMRAHDPPRVAVLAQDVADARAVAERDRASLFASSVVAVVRDRERRVVGDPRARCEPPARGSRSPRPTTTARPSRGRAARRTRPTRSTTARRRKIVNEIARFQRLSSVSTAASGFHDGDERPSASTARPVSPSSDGSAAKRRATRSSRSGG